MSILKLLKAEFLQIQDEPLRAARVATIINQIERLEHENKTLKEKQRTTKTAFDKALEVVEFYGDRSNWENPYDDLPNNLITDDHDCIDDSGFLNRSHGGKKARQAKREIKKILGEERER